jgi:ATP-dependent DNA ligase
MRLRTCPHAVPQTIRLRCLPHLCAMLLRTVRPRPNGFIEPCLPSPASKPPAGAGWIHEIKHDGFRLMARRDAAGVRLFTRRGSDWTGRYPMIATAVASDVAITDMCTPFGRPAQNEFFYQE